MKYLSILTNQSVGLIFTDTRGRIIDPKTIDIDVTLYSRNSNSNVKLSAKNGVFTNCIDRNHGVAAVIEPNQLQSGQLYAEYILNIANSDYSSGVQLIHDVQLLDITIVSKFVGIQQSQKYTTYSVLVLDSVCLDENQTYKPDGADEMWVKSEVDNYMLNYSPNILKPDLSNVNKTAFDGEVAKSQTIADLSNKLDNYAFTNKNGNDFKANKLTSPLDDLHFTENNGIAEVNINPKLLEEHYKEGLYYQLGNDEQINSKYNKARIYFRNPIVKGAGRVCQDINSKSFIIQNINIIDDPDINNGTTFILAANFEPTKNSLPITQDGQIKFTFCDDEDKPLYDINGDECASEILYKSGDMPKREVLL